MYVSCRTYTSRKFSLVPRTQACRAGALTLIFLVFTTLASMTQEHFIMVNTSRALNFQVQLLPEHKLFAVCVGLVLEHRYYPGLCGVGLTHPNMRNSADGFSYSVPKNESSCTAVFD